MYKCVCGAVVAMVPVWKPEDNMWESALPFYLWALGIKFKLSGLVADTVNYWAILLVQWILFSLRFWGWTPGPCTCQTSAVPLNYISSPFLHPQCPMLMPSPQLCHSFRWHMEHWTQGLVGALKITSTGASWVCARFLVCLFVCTNVLLNQRTTLVLFLRHHPQALSLAWSLLNPLGWLSREPSPQCWDYKLVPLWLAFPQRLGGNVKLRSSSFQDKHCDDWGLSPACFGFHVKH